MLRYGCSATAANSSNESDLPAPGSIAMTCIDVDFGPFDGLISIRNFPIDRLALADAPAIVRFGPKAQFVEDLIYDGIMSVKWLGTKLTFSIPDKEIVIEE